MTEQASSHILKHHVSLGCFSDGERLSNPNGSGTFVSFFVDGKRAYGILTAAHVARCLPLIVNGAKQQFIGLTKPSQGEAAHACVASFRFMYFSADIRHFHFSDGSAYRPDIAFILLEIDGFPKHELFEQSEFYDLETDVVFLLEEDTQVLSGFFRGACPQAEVSEDGFLNTPVCLGGGEKICFDDRAFVQFWHIPNTSRKSIKGGSGAGFWRFRYDQNRLLMKSFAGVITAEGPDCDYIEAIAAPYIFETFLPSLKTQVQHVLSQAGS